MTDSAALVAQSLDTDPTTGIDSVPVSVLMYTEIPAGTFVAGPDGIYDVERANGKVRPATMLTIMMARS